FHLVHFKAHRTCFALAARQGQNPVKPIDFRVGSLEPHHGPEIIMSRIDIVAPRQPFHYLGWSVPKPVAGDHDTRTLVGFDDVTRLDISGSVCADNLPIRAAWKNPPIELWSAHASAKDADHAPFAIGCAAETGDALELCVDRENGLFSQ